MFAKTPSGKFQAFVGAQFGHPVFLTCVSVAELQKWTFSDVIHNTRKISRHALAPGSESTAIAIQLITLPPIVLGTRQSLSTTKAKRSEDLVYVHLDDEIEYTIITGHDTIAALAGDTHGTNFVTVEIHTQLDLSQLPQLGEANQRSASRTSHTKRSILDDRGEWMAVTRQTIDEVEVFTGRVDMTKTALSNRSRNLFTFSAIHQANIHLLGDRKQLSVEERGETAVQFWNTVAANMPDWQAAYAEKILPADYRSEFVCAHGIALAGLARAGRSLLVEFPKTWPAKLKKLRTLNWRRSNTTTWEGRAMIAGRLSKSSTCVVLTGNVLKQTLGLSLNEHESEVEVASTTGRT